MKAAALILAMSLAAAGQSANLARPIERLLASPGARGAFWGIQVTDLKTGRTLYQLNADRLFVPASNTKLLTTALALVRLGPQFRFETRVVAGANPDAAGCIHGPLRIEGGGDPNLSARPVPYQPGTTPAGAPAPGYALKALAELADQVAAKGVRSIDGSIVGDDTWYVWEPYPEDWTIEDPTYEYGAAVSALAINDNTITVSVSPGAREGDPAAITLEPAVEYYAISNRVRTVAAGGERKFDVRRAPGSLELELSGTIPLGAAAADLALGIADPAEYAALAFRQLLEERGIAVRGAAVARHLPLSEAAFPAADGEDVVLARRVSAPLVEDLQITDKASQNLHAEMALRAVGRARRNVGSRAAGLEELRAFLAEAGVPDGSYSIEDGSGLSRPNLVAPAAMVKLLRYMYASPLRDTWISFLPVAGRDGTLAGRFDDTPVAGRIHAKTGSVEHVNALSGYVQRRNGSWAAFSILVNNSNQSAAQVRAVMDKICILIWK